MIKTVIKLGVLAYGAYLVHKNIDKITEVAQGKVVNFIGDKEGIQDETKAKIIDATPKVIRCGLFIGFAYGGHHILSNSTVGMPLDRTRKYTTTESMSISQAARNRARTTKAMRHGLRVTPKKGIESGSLEHELYLREQMIPINRMRVQRSLKNALYYSALGATIWKAMPDSQKESIKKFIDELEQMGRGLFSKLIPNHVV